MAKDEVIGFLPIGAGQLILAVADGAKQTIVGAPKSAGVGYPLALWCKSATTNAEVYVIIGGSE
jgi:hypothetical protein